MARMEASRALWGKRHQIQLPHRRTRAAVGDSRGRISSASNFIAAGSTAANRAATNNGKYQQDDYPYDESGDPTIRVDSIRPIQYLGTVTCNERCAHQLGSCAPCRFRREIQAIQLGQKLTTHLGGKAAPACVNRLELTVAAGARELTHQRSLEIRAWPV